MSVQEERALQDLVRFIIMYVARTHFDLAWWMIRRLFVDFRFEPVMSALVKTLEENPRLRFTVDGQAYLVFRWITNTISPKEIASRTRRIIALVRSGQLQVGPSWVLPDEFLAPGEAQIRNLLIGRQISMELGAPKLQVVDHSDVFGHPAQVPQFMSHFTGTYVYTRGNTEAQIGSAAHRWEAPDGSYVMSIPHPGGYGNGYEFASKDLDTSLRTVSNFDNNYFERYMASKVPLGLLCGGGDHTALAPRILEDIAEAMKVFSDINILIGTDNDYAEHLNLDPAKLPVIRGELYASGRQNILRHVDSARMYIKQRNAEVATVLSQAETAVSLAYLRTRKWTPHLLNSLQRCWSDFLVLQSHDAVTGCHVDDVSDDMLIEYNRIEQELHMVMQTAMCELAGIHFSMAHRQRYGLVPTPEFALWNSLPYERSEVAIVNLPDTLQGTFRLAAKVNGQESKVQRLDETRAALPVAMGSGGSATIEILKDTKNVPWVRPTVRTISNEYLAVRVNPNGTFDVDDLVGNQTFWGLGRLTSQGDRGDTYNRDLLGDEVNSSSSEATYRVTVDGQLVQELEIKFDFIVPEHLDASRLARTGRVAIPVVTTLRLRRGSRHLEVNTRIINRASDQLLRVEFPVGQKLDESRALSTFIVQPHPVPAPTDPNWLENTTDFEPPFTTFSNQGMVVVGPLVSFDLGLPEYEVFSGPDGKAVYAHTLLRGVGFLSRDDIRTRRPDPTSKLAGAGPQLATPGAQCLGEQSFDYALGFVGQSSDIDLAQEYQKWQHGFVTAPFELDTNGILNFGKSQLVFSVLKPAEDGNGCILRAWAGHEPAHLILKGTVPPDERLTTAEEPSSEDGLKVARNKIASWRYV